MQINEYFKIRETGKNLAYKILNFDKDGKNAMLYAGILLGFWNGKAMVFDKEEETDVLMDFLIYEKNKYGQKLIDQFYDSDFELTDLEEEIVEGQVNYHCSLFEIVKIDKLNSTLILKDLLNKEMADFILMDMGLSQTAKIGLLMYTRLIPIREMNMTSGVSFGFEPRFKERILNDISLERLKKRRKPDSTELYIFMHKKSKLYGIEIDKIETWQK